MKKIIFISLITLFQNISIAQDFGELAHAKFKTKESYKLAENNVLECTNYLFDNPATEELEMNRLISIQYIMKWMEGTEYSFEIGEMEMELIKGNSDLLGLYLAAMAKVVIENKAKKLTNDDIYNKAKGILVKYCSVSENKVKPSKELKKEIKKM